MNSKNNTNKTYTQTSTEEIPIDVIKRYLVELGYNDVTPEQLQELKLEIARRIKLENDAAKSIVSGEPKPNYLEQSTSSDPEDEHPIISRGYSQQPISAQSIPSQQPNIKIVDKRKKTTKQTAQEQSDSSDGDAPYEDTSKPLIPNLSIKSDTKKPQNVYMGMNARPMSSTSRATRMAQLMGPNRLTLAQKQRRNADPVSRHLQYEQMWAIQGAPQDRPQRLWQQKLAAMQVKANVRYKDQDFYD